MTEQLTPQQLDEMPDDQFMATVDAIIGVGAEGKAVLDSAVAGPEKSGSEQKDEGKAEAADAKTAAESPTPDNPPTPKAEGEADSTGKGEKGKAATPETERALRDAKRARHNASVAAGRLKTVADDLKAKDEQTRSLEQELTNLRHEIDALKKAPASPLPTGESQGSGEPGPPDLNARIIKAFTQLLDDPEAAEKIDVAGAIAAIADAKMLPHVEQMKALQTALEEQRTNEASESFWLKVVTENPRFNTLTESPGFAEFLKQSRYGVPVEDLWNQAIARGDYASVGEIASDYERARAEAEEPQGRTSRMSDRASVMSPAPGHPPRQTGPKTYTVAEWDQKQEAVQNRMRRGDDSADAEFNELQAAMLEGRVG